MTDLDPCAATPQLLHTALVEMSVAAQHAACIAVAAFDVTRGDSTQSDNWRTSRPPADTVSGYERWMQLGGALLQGRMPCAASTTLHEAAIWGRANHPELPPLQQGSVIRRAGVQGQQHWWQHCIVRCQNVRRGLTTSMQH